MSKNIYGQFLKRTKEKKDERAKNVVAKWMLGAFFKGTMAIIKALCAAYESKKLLKAALEQCNLHGLTPAQVAARAGHTAAAQYVPAAQHN